MPLTLMGSRVGFGNYSKKKAHVEAIHTSSVHQMIGNIDIIEMLLML